MTLKTHTKAVLATQRAFLFLFFLCLSTFVSAQAVVEDCNNGIDDDGDGLIDCFDTDCTCTGQCDDFYYSTCNPDCYYLPPCGPITLATKWSSNAETGTYSPLVAGDLDGDGIPEVVTTRVEEADLYILDGATGQIKVHVIHPTTVWPGGTAPAIADLDNDGLGEIVIVGFDRRLYCYDHAGALQFVSPGLVGYDFRYRYAVPNIADFNHDGLPEVNLGNQIFSGQTGALLSSGGNFFSDGEHPARVAVGYSFASTVAVDALPNNACFSCGGLEIVAGNQVLAVNFFTGINFPIVSAPPGYSDGFTSVADFDGDGDLDAIVQGQRNGQNTVYVWDIQTSTVLREYTLLNNWSEGASRVNVTDLDGDGLLDVSFVSHPWIYALSNDFTPLWINPIFDPSSITCTSVFDFCGDGSSEIVYRSEEKLQILDGTTGNTIWEDVCLSFTHIENPLVLDVDADGKTEILIECGTNGSPFTGTVVAYEIVGTPNITSRKVWNQHGYFNTNINEDLSVPRFQQLQHIVGGGLLNSFMNQYFNPTFPSPDAILTLLGEPICSADSLIITVEICNVGDNIFPLNTPISAYAGNPQTTAAVPVGVVANSPEIGLGMCDTVTFRIPRIANDTVFLVLNDDNSTLPPFNLSTDFPITGIGECAFTNNVAAFYFAYQPAVVSLGQDTSICDLSLLLLNAGGQDLVSWEWQDGSIDTTFSALGPGTYSVTTTDVCALTQSDTLVVDLFTATVLDLGLDQGICPGDSAMLTAPGFDTYTWSSPATLTCTTCPAVSVSPSGPTFVTLEASYDYGCSAKDTILITLFDTYDYSVDTLVCYGSSVVWNGQNIDADSSYQFDLQTIHGCDSLVMVRVMGTGVGTYNITVDTAVCLGQTLMINNTEIAPEDEMTFLLSALTGCDSTVLVRVAPLDTFFLFDTRVQCFGDTSIIFGVPQTVSGEYIGRFTASNGCDSTQLVSLLIYPKIALEIDGTPACFGESNAILTANVLNGVDPLQYAWDFTSNTSPQINNLTTGDYSVTVTDGNDCTETATINLGTYPPSIFSADIDTVRCFGQSNGGIQLQTNDPALLFQFESGPFTQTYEYSNLSAGTYQIVSQDVFECQDTLSLTITEPPQIFVQLPADTTVVLGASVPLLIQLGGLPPVSWNWSDTSYLSCLACPDPIVQTPLENRRYTLTIIDENGCIASDDWSLMVEQVIGVYIPNAMGGTGDNETLLLGFGPAVRKVNLFRIYDRWGDLLHESRNALPGDASLNWDGRFKGKQMNPGVYMWQIEVELVSGSLVKKIGDLTIIR